MTVSHLAPSRLDHALRSLLAAVLVLLATTAAGKFIASAVASDGAEPANQACCCNFILPEPYKGFSPCPHVRERHVQGT